MKDAEGKEINTGSIVVIYFCNQLYKGIVVALREYDYEERSRAVVQFAYMGVLGDRPIESKHIIVI